jgi:hypothetical protein
MGTRDQMRRGIAVKRADMRLYPGIEIAVSSNSQPDPVQSMGKAGLGH